MLKKNKTDGGSAIKIESESKVGNGERKANKYVIRQGSEVKPYEQRAFSSLEVEALQPVISTGRNIAHKVAATSTNNDASNTVSMEYSI